MVDNQDRAAFASQAVSAFRRVCITDYEDAIGDLICDLLHLARRDYPGCDPRALAEKAISLFEEEEKEDRIFNEARNT